MNIFEKQVKKPLFKQNISLINSVARFFFQKSTKLFSNERKK